MNTERPTPETDAACWTETNQANALVMASFARRLERERDELQEQLNLRATQLFAAINERNSLVNQIDLLRDEFQRIWARIAETGLAETHCELRSIADYCQRAQRDIEVNCSVIKERDDALMLGVYKLGCEEQKDRIRRLEEGLANTLNAFDAYVLTDEQWTNVDKARELLPKSS